MNLNLYDTKQHIPEISIYFWIWIVPLNVSKENNVRR
jgi:hypothetical protein